MRKDRVAHSRSSEHPELHKKTNWIITSVKTKVTPKLASEGIKTDTTRQIEIIHLSDLHFGSHHRFDPPQTPAGDFPKRVGYPKLIDKLKEDLRGIMSSSPAIVCLTGDFATTCSANELEQAEEFIRGIAKSGIVGSTKSLENIFVVPGNHDVIYTSSNVKKRWEPFVKFFNRLWTRKVKPNDP